VLDREDIVGGTLQNKYLIGRLLDQGSNGKVYKVTDKENPKSMIVMKIT
jgi:hypothetical protein